MLGCGTLRVCVVFCYCVILMYSCPHFAVSKNYTVLPRNVKRVKHYELLVVLFQDQDIYYR